MSRLDLSRLVELLRATEEQETFSPPPISDYILQHIVEPLLRDETVLFSQLDFTAFSEEDLDMLESYCYARGETEHQLSGINSVFCQAPPVSLGSRTFC